MRGVIKMILYNIELQYPISTRRNDRVEIVDQTEHEVVKQFQEFKWCDHRNMQLQVASGETSFTVLSANTGQTIRFTLLEYGTADRLEVMMESDIIASMSRKDLFVLINRRIKNSIRLKKFERVEFSKLSNARHHAKNYMNRVLDMSTKELFSFMNRRIKDYITFDRISIDQAEAYLNLFLHHHIDVLEAEYKHKVMLSKKAA